MCTRCNIIVWNNTDSQEPKFVAQIYHHSDGYLEGVGAELASRIVSFLGEVKDSPADFVTEMSNDDPSYEIDDYVTDKPYPHSDIEWRYDVFFGADNIVVKCKEYLFAEVDEDFDWSADDFWDSIPCNNFEFSVMKK